jgi:hypothetical protein
MLDNKQFLNPSYYDNQGNTFDLRVGGSNLKSKDSKLIKSIFWNKRTHKVLK